MSLRPPPWAVFVFLLALAARVGFVFLADEPLLYAHQYTYFRGALRIAEHPQPLRYVVTSEEWRTWDQHWTIAPLYHLFAAAVVRAFGAHLLVLRILQCALDSVAAVAVGALGRRTAGPRGSWAGAVYAAYWPAVEMPSWTMTENLHTVLLVVSVALLAREAAPPGSGRAFCAGALLGISALARSVSTGFLGLAALWRLLRGGLRRGALPAALLAAGGAAVILPWTARNVFVIGDPVLIETAAFENIWWANHFVDSERFERQARVVHGQATPAEKRAAALHFALRGIQRNPRRFLEKIPINLRHFLRPEGLQNLLRAERPLEEWRHLGNLLLDDAVLVLSVPLFLVFLLAGRASLARQLIVLWTAYYLFMVVVIFHNEVRYRSAFVPFAFAGAAGGIAVLADREARRKWRTRVALGLALCLAGSMVGPFAGPAWRAGAVALALRPALAAAGGSDLGEAERLATLAAAKDPRSPRPWFEYGERLLREGHPGPALEAYERGAGLATVVNWRAVLARPLLLGQLGRPDEARRALRALDRLSWDIDPWLVLEIAWRELPPPRADTIVLGQGDYGAVRGFLHPRGGDPGVSAHRLEWNKYEELGGEVPPPGTHRWSRHRAWLRLLPASPAAAYDVTLHMSSPFPSPLASPEVTVRVNDGEPSRFTLGREVRRCTLRVSTRPGELLLVRIDAPTWSRAGEPADQGVRVDRLTVSPAAP